MVEDCAGEGGCACGECGATVEGGGAPGPSTRDWDCAAGMQRLRRKTLAGNATRVRIMANLPSPASAWPCRVPSSYPQRYQIFSAKGSFSCHQPTGPLVAQVAPSRLVAGWDRTSLPPARLRRFASWVVRQRFAIAP